MKYIKKIPKFSIVSYLIAVLLFLAYIIWVYKLKSRGVLSVKEVIDTITTVVGWVIVLLIGFIHLEKTRRNNQIAKRDETRKLLEREAIREINRAITNFSRILTDINTKYLMLPIRLNLYIKSPNIFVFNPADIEPGLRSGEIDLLNGLTEFILAIETNEIVVVKFNHLRKYIQFRAYDVIELIGDFLEYFGNIEVEKLMTEEGQSEFKEKCAGVYTKLLDIQCHLHDYRIELTNSFFAEIFDDKVPIRKPKDPNFKTLAEVAIKEEVEKEEQERENRALKNKKDV